jgi:hypothetical protein
MVIAEPEGTKILLFDPDVTIFVTEFSLPTVSVLLLPDIFIVLILLPCTVVIKLFEPLIIRSYMADWPTVDVTWLPLIVICFAKSQLVRLVPSMIAMPSAMRNRLRRPVHRHQTRPIATPARMRPAATEVPVVSNQAATPNGIRLAGRRSTCTHESVGGLGRPERGVCRSHCGTWVDGAGRSCPGSTTR